MTSISGETGDPGAGGVATDAAGTRRFSTRHATPWPQLAGLALLGAALGYAAKAPCRFGGAWLDGTQYAASCYSDVFPLYYRDGLDQGIVPYLDVPVEYPVLTGGLMHLLARSVSWLPDQLSRALGYFDVTALVLALCLGATVIGVGHLAGRGGLSGDGRAFDRRRALIAGAFTALAPAAVLTAYINWDLLAVALATGGLVAHAHRRPWLAGALIGLAVAAKFYPLLFLGPMFVLVARDVLRGRGSVGDFLRPLGGALIAWTAVNLPVALAAPQAWATFFRFSSERGADWGSVYYGLGGFGLFDTADLDRINTVGTGGLLLACVGIALLGLFARRRPPLEQLLFLVVAAFLITNKVWSPQFVLWLVPLAALAWPRRSRGWPALVVFGVWQLAEIGYVLGIWRHLMWSIDPATGLGFEGYAVLLFARLFSLLAVAVLIVVDCLSDGDSAS
ncbi:glycosyltransferase family 87 protein [Marinactinospora thermotolerans]|uniref:glycosyltransferase family 87 protein n=1 Tax=Marinactinospora thermotolerans TaxID=531310 RepID=UPI003D8D5207